MAATWTKTAPWVAWQAGWRDPDHQLPASTSCDLELLPRRARPV